MTNVLIGDIVIMCEATARNKWRGDTMTLEQLNKAIAEAGAKFAAEQTEENFTALQAAMKARDKAKAEVAKEQAEKARAEAEALAGKREALATAIHQQVRQLGLDKSLAEVKSWGFTYKLDKMVPNESDTSYKSVALSVQTVKVKTGKGGGGNTGKSKDEYGKSLGEIFEEFANDEDRTKLAAATSGSAQWQVKVAVKKAAIASGALKPVK